MRFEAKHCYFKKLAVKIGNFVNIVYTLSLRHQCLRRYHNLNKVTVVDDEPECGPGTTICPQDLSDCTIPHGSAHIQSTCTYR